VLEFLNAARTAQEIADAVEIPGEPDIGLILGQRLLEQRDRVGGYTDLRQIREIRLIGPERFTEIVACLSDAPLPWGEDEPDDLRLELQALRREIENLKGVLAATPRVRLRALQSQSYLGQATNLV